MRLLESHAFVNNVDAFRAVPGVPFVVVWQQLLSDPVALYGLINGQEPVFPLDVAADKLSRAQKRRS